MGAYQDELRDIRRKSRVVYSKRGIAPFLQDDLRERVRGDRSDYLPGFQIFSLFGGIIDEEDQETLKNLDK